MRVLDRYILREFFKILILAVIGATFLSILVDVIEKIDTFIDREATLADVARYYLYHIPYIAVLTFPASMLIATIFTVGQCNRWNELTAMKASGVSLYRTLLPLFITALAFSILTLVIGEAIIPSTNGQKRAIYDHRILKKPEHRAAALSLRYQGKRGILYSIQRYDPVKGRMDEVTVVQQDPDGHLVYRIDANRGEWKGNRWFLKDGYLRYFSEKEEETTFRFAVLTSRDLVERPDDFIQPPKKPEDMNYFELEHFIDRQRRGGGSTLESEVYLRLKLAFPFANLIIVLFGAPLATISKRGGTAANFGISLFIFILFWGFIHISRAMGESGTIHPILSAWIANIAFGAIGLMILAKVRK